MTEDSTRDHSGERPRSDAQQTDWVDLDRTQEFRTAPGRAPMLPAPEPTRQAAPDWRTEAHPAYTPNPYAVAAAPGPTPPVRRGGPGWLGVLLIAGLSALLAGVGGGLFGGWLGSTDRFDGLDLRGDSPNAAAPEPGAGATTRPEGTVANIAANATPSVVTIRVEAGSGDGTGSGWVLDDKGHIVTNNHVIAAAANGGEITVVLSNGKQSRRRSSAVTSPTTWPSSRSSARTSRRSRSGTRTPSSSATPSSPWARHWVWSRP